MVIVRIYANDIDYNTIVNIAMPYIEKGLTEKDNIFLNVFKNIISNEGKPTGLSRFLVSLIPNKDKVAASILPHFEEALIAYLNDLLSKNQIHAAIRALSIKNVERSQEKMLKIEVTIDEIDYEQTIENLGPVILQRLTEQDSKAGSIIRLLMTQKDLPGNILKAVIGEIPKQQRDGLLADILMEFREELKETANTLVEKNNIRARISDIQITGIQK